MTLWAVIGGAVTLLGLVLRWVLRRKTRAERAVKIVRNGQARVERIKHNIVHGGINDLQDDLDRLAADMRMLRSLYGKKNSSD